MKWILRVLLVVLLLAQLLCAAVWVQVNDYVTWRMPRSQVARQQIELIVGKTYEVSFVADRDTRYEVELGFTIPTPTPEFKSAFSSDLGVSAEVVDEMGTVIGTGSIPTEPVRDYFGPGPTHGRSFLSVQKSPEGENYLLSPKTREGQRYIVRIKTNRTLPELNRCSPAVVVNWGRFQRKGYFARVDAARLTGDLSQIVSVSLILVFLAALRTGAIRFTPRSSETRAIREP